MIPQFFFLSQRGDHIVFRDYRGEVPKGSAEIFFRKVKLEFLVMSWISNSIERCQSQNYQYVPCKPISNFIKHGRAQDTFAMNDMEYLW
uniref:Uncharacterized protein n=1 Tax=Zea mays TaxID=4577 RepID=B6T8H7_MAIZE|nr:hypothetical protein [Zea mays]ACG46858.1 hypothetical protein [Zea mays]